MLSNQGRSLDTTFRIPNECLEADQGPHVKALKLPNVGPIFMPQIAPARAPQPPEERKRWSWALWQLGAPQSSGGPLNYLGHIFIVRNHFCSLAVDITKPILDTTFLILERGNIALSAAVPRQSNTVSRPHPNYPKKLPSQEAPQPTSKTS